MSRFMRAMATACAASALALGFGSAASAAAPAAAGGRQELPEPPRAIKHILVIELENEDASTTFGPGSPATYLTGTLLQMGELVQNYYATGHVSTDNYISQVSGQAPNQITSSDCVTSITSLSGSFDDVTPGMLDVPGPGGRPGLRDAAECADDRGPAGRGLPVERRDELA
jgi:phosphatidylinositol-3-phosphatase